MNYRNVALFSDLDGTLFDSGSAIQKDNLAAIGEFVRAGGLFAVSTGRSYLNCASLLEPLEINCPSILLNGSALFSFEDKRLLSHYTLPYEPVKAFLADALRRSPELNVQVYPVGKACFVSPPATADEGFLRGHLPCEMLPLEDAPSPWLKVLIQGGAETLRQLRACGESLLAGAADFVSSGPVYLELLPHGVNKGSALREAASLPVLEGRVTVAIGDYYNDRELLRCADISAAPENAPPDLRALADYTVCRNDDGAVADLLRNVLPKI